MMTVSKTNKEAALKTNPCFDSMCPFLQMCPLHVMNMTRQTPPSATHHRVACSTSSQTTCVSGCHHHHTHTTISNVPHYYIFTPHNILKSILHILHSLQHPQQKPHFKPQKIPKKLFCEYGFWWTEIPPSEARDTTWQRTCLESNTPIHQPRI